VGAVPSILSPGGLQSKVASAADISASPKPVAPVAAPPAPVAPTPVAPNPVTPSSPATPASKSVSADAEKATTEIKIKIANINKTLLDLEMQNITGELSDADFNDKTARLQNVKKQLEQQLRELGS
jgi:ribosomal protein L29